MSYQWDFAAIWPYRMLLLEGLWGTIQIGVTSIVFGMLAGIILAIMKNSPLRLVRIPAIMIIGFYRNTPAIVHFFWIYYALPVVSPLTLSPFAAAVLALSAQSAAFYAEVYRGGIQSISNGQWEGAKALGMPRATALRRIILPQALRRMIPPFLERSFELLKSTALASSLAYSELLYQAMQVNSQTYRPLEVYTLIAVMYFTLLLIISQCSQMIEKRLAVSDAR
ncbi:amino acid ABC transporter permease [Pantoea cypripedii]|uniref:ABC transporter permease n=1 Tax=Pantoea cypripedii TaxID=55209 RepID=A0A1X1EKT3_PANCY|nr:amino acid ABC transporter permease [Pantoea cypripedii]MBP2198767.1 polar amino acid transport system permease protein [Pantoea cypripedii]ORM89550.1 ABC transporter permease [Pantoea cypripedii]